MSEQAFNVYLPLDTLFDMRLGQVRHYCPDAEDVIFKKRVYWDRKFTNWFKLSGGVIADCDGWEYNDDVLRKSNLTGIVEYVLYLSQLHRENVGRGLVDAPLCLCIDTHGYTLGDEAKTCLSEHLRTIVQTSSFKIEYVEIGIDALTPEKVDECFGGLIMYHAMDWLAKYRDALFNYTESHPTIDKHGGILSEVYLIAPLLHNKETPGISSGEERKGYSVFKAAVRPIISLEFIHVSYFSEYIEVPEETRESQHSRLR